MVKRLLGTSAALLTACVITATAAPLPSYDYLGTYKAIRVTTNNQGVNTFMNSLSVRKADNSGNVNLNGGGFQGEFSKTNATNYTATTTVWCVDSQLQFSSGNAYEANVNLLATGGTGGYNASQVRYGNISGNTAGTYNSGQSSKFVYDVGLSGAADSAFYRYRMAAYLLSNYNGFPAGPTDTPPTGGADDQKNDAIQRAIWRIMYNNSGANNYRYDGSTDYASGFATATGLTAGQKASVSNWIQAAWQFVNDANNESFFRQWAVVTWDVNSSGNPNGSSTPDKQTFLVRIVPEPGFYGMLALGLGGLMFAVRRKKFEA